MSFSLSAGWFLELLLGVILLLAFARWSGSKAVLGLELASFGIRLVLGEALYAISLLGLPFLKSQQIGGGFWTFAPDAHRYQADALLALTAMNGGPRSADILDFPWLLAALYRVFGADPSQGLLLNAILAAGCIPLVYMTMRWAGAGSRPAVAAAGIVGFWPSTFAWSSQLLKDPALWFALFALLAGCAYLMRLDGKPMVSRLLAAAAVVTCSQLLSAWLRGGAYANPVVLVAAATGMTVLVIANWHKQRLRALLSVAVLAVALALGNITAGQSVSTAAGMGIAVAEGGVSTVLAPADVKTSAVSPFLPSGLWSAAQARNACRPVGSLLAYRYGFYNTPGDSQLDVQPFFSCGDVLAYLPRAFELSFLYPTPDLWFRKDALTSTQGLVALDGIGLWLLFPGICVAALTTLARPKPFNFMLVAYTIVFGLLLGLIVANYGALARLRLVVSLPSALIAVQGWTTAAHWARKRLSPHHYILRVLGPPRDSPVKLVD